jgi:hypothetical protein
MVFSPQSDGVPEGCDSGDRHGQPIALNDPQRQNPNARNATAINNQAMISSAPVGHLRSVGYGRKQIPSTALTAQLSPAR